jgi:hypothetical protein
MKNQSPHTFVGFYSSISLGAFSNNSATGTLRIFAME